MQFVATDFHPRPNNIYFWMNACVGLQHTARRREPLNEIRAHNKQNNLWQSKQSEVFATRPPNPACVSPIFFFLSPLYRCRGTKQTNRESEKKNIQNKTKHRTITIEKHRKNYELQFGGKSHKATFRQFSTESFYCRPFQFRSLWYYKTIVWYCLSWI